MCDGDVWHWLRAVDAVTDGVRRVRRACEPPAALRPPLLLRVHPRVRQRVPLVRRARPGPRGRLPDARPRAHRPQHRCCRAGGVPLLPRRAHPRRLRELPPPRLRPVRRQRRRRLSPLRLCRCPSSSSRCSTSICNISTPFILNNNGVCSSHKQRSLCLSCSCLPCAQTRAQRPCQHRHGPRC